MPGFEDSISGETDVSGSPPPVRAPSDVRADQSRQVKARSRSPKIEGAGDSGDQSAEPSGAKPETGKAPRPSPMPGPAPQSAPDAGPPIDWGQDLEKAWGFARNAYGALSGAYHDGVHNTFQGHDARSKVLQSSASALLDGIIPILALKESGQEVVSQLGV